MKKLTTILPFALSILIGVVFGIIWVEKIHIGARNIAAFAYYIAAPTVLWIFFLCAGNFFKKRKYVISLILGGASLAFFLGFGAQIKADFGFPVIADNSNEKPAAIAEQALWAANDGRYEDIKKYLSKRTLYKIGKRYDGDESKYWDYRTKDRSIEELVLLREKAFEKDKVIVKFRYVAGEKIGRTRFTFIMNEGHWKIDN